MRVGQRPDSTIVVEMEEDEAAALLSDLSEVERSASTDRMFDDLADLLGNEEDEDEDDEDG